ncbi:MAG: transposase [Planctomycetaceae bacterium]
MSETQCPEQLELFEVSRQQVTVSFDGGNVVSDAGLLPIRELDRELGILAEAASRLPDPRSSLFVTHSAECILAQQVYQILAGYPDGNDAQLLCDDPLFKTIVGKDDDNAGVSSMPNAMLLFNPAVVMSPVEGHPDLLPADKVANIRERTDGRPQEISPCHFIRADLPPSIIFHGTNDDAVPFPTVQLFQKSMTEAGNRCDLKAYENQPHGFFNPGRGKRDARENATRNYHRTIRKLDEFLVSLGYLSAE